MSNAPPSPNVTASIVQAIQDAITEIQADAALSVQIVTVESSVFAIYSVVMTIASVLLIATGARSVSKKLMLLVCIVMYAMATTHWALSLRTLILQQRFARMLLSTTSSCLSTVLDGAPCPPGLAALQNQLPGQVNPALPTALLSVNIVLGDCIVLWRAWILWARNRSIQAVSVLLIASTLVTSSLCSATAGDPIEAVWGMSAFALSWATNVWATGLISLKAWQYRRVITHDLLGANARAQAEKALMLFVDSGILYCALWTVMVAGALRSMLPGTTTSSAKFGSDVLKFKESGLIHAIGIYPTAVVILVALTKSYCERTLRFDSLPTLQFDLSHRRAASQSDRSLPQTLDTDIQPSARTASSVVDGECSLPSTIAVPEKVKYKVSDLG